MYNENPQAPQYVTAVDARPPPSDSRRASISSFRRFSRRGSRQLGQIGPSDPASSLSVVISKFCHVREATCGRVDTYCSADPAARIAMGVKCRASEEALISAVLPIWVIAIAGHVGSAKAVSACWVAACLLSPTIA